MFVEVEKDIPYMTDFDPKNSNSKFTTNFLI
jgi:hypothetical protein